MNVLVTGGAGYIGSHAVRALAEAGHAPVVLDSLILGHRAAVKGADLVVGDIRDSALVARLLAEYQVDTVMHFAAFAQVGESMADPMKYYDNNTAGTLSLLKTMLECGVHRFIFSSTAATYGEPATVPIPESAPKNPINVYGHSKRMVEEACGWLARLTPLRYTALRYFNACGCHPDGDIGEDHRPETHLIPLVLQVPLGKRRAVSIFGDDYDTPDGTCIRDYIHVMDLARAHVKAMEYLAAGGEAGEFNLGTNEGYSVRQIVEAARRVTGHAIPEEVAPRRPGDPARLVAAVDRAMTAFDWKPTASDLDTIVGTAWNWMRGHPDGYADADR